MLTLTDTKSGDQVSIESGVPSLLVGFVRENGSYRIDFESNGNRDVSLLVSDEEIPPAYKELTANKTRIRWNWQITEYAGEVVFTLLEGDESFAEAVLDIAPNPYKLGSEVYRELLLDLQEKAEGLLFGTTPAQVRLQHQEAEVPPLARFALLRSYLPALERAFRNIEQAPHRRLIAEREERPLHKVQRVDNRSLRTALKRMPVLAALSNRDSTMSGEHATLNVPRREHTYNTSPNRHVLAILHRLAALCADLCDRFDGISANQGEEPDYRRRAERWATLSHRFEKQVNRLRRADFLSGLRPSKPDAAALMTISRHPAYSHFDRIARHILSPRVALGGDADKLLSLRPTYDIYEYWCFFMVVEAIQKAMPGVTWKSNINITPSKLLLSLKNGSSLDGTVGDTEISVVFQQRYRKEKNSDGLFSISKTCIPDIVLKLKHGETLRTIIFDAKYRSSWESIHAALSDVHVYRDAIRRDADNSGIEAAFILTPAHHTGLERYYTTEYHKQFSFGAFDLSPRNMEQFNQIVQALSTIATDD